MRADYSGNAGFFLSRRRRHTISKRDWSSDVWSSDLRNRRGHSSRFEHRCILEFRDKPFLAKEETMETMLETRRMTTTIALADSERQLCEVWTRVRSEERRVGEACACGIGAYVGSAVY